MFVSFYVGRLETFPLYIKITFPDTFDKCCGLLQVRDDLADHLRLVLNIRLFVGIKNQRSVLLIKIFKQFGPSLLASPEAENGINQRWNSYKEQHALKKYAH